MVNFDPYLVYTIQILKNRQGWAHFSFIVFYLKAGIQERKMGTGHWTEGTIIKHRNGINTALGVE